MSMPNSALHARNKHSHRHPIHLVQSPSYLEHSLKMGRYNQQEGSCLESNYLRQWGIGEPMKMKKACLS